LEEAKEDGGRGESNIPLSPLAIASVRTSVADLEKGYDSDGQIGPFFDAVIGEGPLETEEGNLPEVGDVGDDPSGTTNENDTATSTNDPTNNAGKFVDITDEDLKKLKVTDLKAELAQRGCAQSGVKTALFDRLKDALEKRLPNLSATQTVARKIDDLKGFAPTARWKPLVPIPVPVEEPRNVAPSMRAPTIPEEDADFVPQKHDYAEVFDRLPFVSTKKAPALYRNGKVKRDQSGRIMYEDVPVGDGCPKPEFLRKHGLDINSKPVDWFNAFLPVYTGKCKQNQRLKCLTHIWAEFTNKKALMQGAGQPRGLYPTFKPFTHEEIERHLALYILQGLNPSPQIEQKFSSQMNDPVQGSDLCFRAFGPGAVVRHKQFKLFFSIQDPMKPTPSRKARPNHKVDPFLRHIQEVSMEAWHLGRDIAGDEQTIGFQGNHKDKRRITYKAEGDGFQCDAICQKGFTWTFYFRNQPAPKKWIDKGLSPLHARILGMFDQLDSKCHNCWFDNLYLSAKFAKASYCHQKIIRIAGPTRKSGRGLPKFVLQEEVKNPKEIRQVRGTVKAAVLEGDPSVPDLVAVSYYDQKPVHFLSTICETIKWIQLEKKVYCVETGEVEVMKFLRLNINNDYNHDMGHVDISDQLRNYYRFDHWMRKRKWWWALFFWGMGVSLVNAYVCYKEVCEQNNVKPMSHYEWRKSIALAWIDPNQYWPSRYSRTSSINPQNLEVSDETSDRTGKRKASDDSVTTSSSKRATAITDEALDPRTGRLRDRLAVGHGLHMPEAATDWAKCSLHNWAAKKRTRAQIVKCSTCGINLCLVCFKGFHTIQEVSVLRNSVDNKYSNRINDDAIQDLQVVPI
jgi:hypothetical protein